MSTVTTRNRVSKGVTTGGQFAAERRAEDLSVELGHSDQLGNTVCSFAFSDQQFTVDCDGPGHYVVYEGDEQLVDFDHTGDPQDHDSLQEAALQALEDQGEIERCRAGCGSDLDDGQGFDGYCGDCADGAEAEGEWDHWYADPPHTSLAEIGPPARKTS